MGGGIAPAKEIDDPLFAHGFVLLGRRQAGRVRRRRLVRDPQRRLRPLARQDRRGDRHRTGARDALLRCTSTTHPIADLEAQQLLEKHKARGDLRPRVPREDGRRASPTRRRSRSSRREPVTHIGTGQAKVEKVASNRRYTDANGKVHYNRMSRDPRPEDPRRRGGDDRPVPQDAQFWDGDTPLLRAARPTPRTR